MPGGGRLLVESGDGAWVVRADGSRRLIGDYDESTWSPHGLYVGAAEGHTLSAVEPDGTPHWSISAAGTVRDPRWSLTPGLRIAYRSGKALRIVHADETNDVQVASDVAPVAPVWSPLGIDQLAYIAGGRLRLVETDARRSLSSAPALAPAR